jgi:hypothetical protein
MSFSAQWEELLYSGQRDLNFYIQIGSEKVFGAIRFIYPYPPTPFPRCAQRKGASLIRKTLVAHTKRKPTEA